MPFGTKPKCSKCNSSSSILWRKNEDADVICNNCALRTPTTNSADGSPVTSRKSLRVKTSKIKQQVNNKSSGSKTKSKRFPFKKSCTRSQIPVLLPCKSRMVYHEGSYIQLGDVVSVINVKGGIYYAQIRGLLEDQYCEKYAVLTWLIPTTKSPKEGFDLKTYLLGPEEDVPRRLDRMRFVCHCDLEYFMASYLTYPLWPPKREYAVVMARAGPKLVPYVEKEKTLPDTRVRGISSDS